MRLLMPLKKGLSLHRAREGSLNCILQTCNCSTVNTLVSRRWQRLSQPFHPGHFTVIFNTIRVTRHP